MFIPETILTVWGSQIGVGVGCAKKNRHQQNRHFSWFQKAHHRRSRCLNIWRQVKRPNQTKVSRKPYLKTMKMCYHVMGTFLLHPSVLQDSFIIEAFCFVSFYTSDRSDFLPTWSLISMTQFASSPLIC